LKKWIAALCILSMTALLCGMKLPEREITVTIDGQAQAYDPSPGMVDGLVLVSVRGISNSLGASVKWDEDTRSASISKKGNVVTLQLNSKTAIMNGRPTQLEVKPQLISERMVIPIRFISEALGAKVIWQGARQTVALTTTIPLPQFSSLDVRETIESELAWVSSLQQSNGLIANSFATNNKNQQRITPYFANLAAEALTSYPDQREVVEAYIAWYFDHINLPDKHHFWGTMYDYYIMPDGKMVSTNDYDSADSYAATFISLLRAYHESGGDVQFLKQNQSKIFQVGGVMLRLLDIDNLSWAKPDYHVKYLMDNSEVYKGLIDLSYLYANVLNNPQYASQVEGIANKVKKAIQTNFSNGEEFFVAITESGGKQAADWKKWYPDSTAQMFPVIFGVVSPNDKKAQYVYQKLNDYHPEWVRLDNGDVFPWTVIGYGAALVGDWTRAKMYYDQIKLNYVDKGHPWPWYSAEAGWFLQMNQEILKNRQLHR
jgi:hypothetical protein